MRLRASILVLAIAVPSFAGCGIFGPDEWEDRRDALERNRDRWNSRRVYSYYYTLDLRCFCLAGGVGPVVIEVTDGEITSLVPVNEDVDVPESEWTSFRTVDELFVMIEAAIDERADRFEVRYHPTAGHPTRIVVDYEEGAADDEVFVDVSDLTILARAN